MKQNEGIISTSVQPPYKPNPRLSPIITNFVVSYSPLCGEVVSYYMYVVYSQMFPLAIRRGRAWYVCMTLRVDTSLDTTYMYM